MTGLSVLAGAAGLVLAAATAAMPAWRIEPAGSAATFGVRLLWLHTVRGRFPGVSGEVRQLPDGRLQVEAQVQVRSLTMTSAHTRRWALSPDFFDADRYPEIRFRSDDLPLQALTRGGPLTGRLTLRGVSRPVRFQLERPGCLPLTQPACPLHAHGSIDRKAFGMTAHPYALASEVELRFTLAVRRTVG